MPPLTFLCLPLQGKDDFERQQKELLDKENIIKQSQVQLGQEQVRTEQVTFSGPRGCRDFVSHAVRQSQSIE